jgi:hypothetical protein
MTMTTLKLRGQEYVLLPRKQYERLTAEDRQRRVAARARKALGKFRAGKLKTMPHEKVKRMLGL